MNFSFFLSFATFRMRSSAWDALSRSCARRVFRCAPCPLVPTLRSTNSEASRPALFTSFTSYYGESHFPRPCIIGYGSSPSRCVPELQAPGQTCESPGSHATSSHTCQVLRPRRAVWVLAFTRPSVLPSAFATASAPGITILRGSMAGLCAPLPTLRRRPYRRPRALEADGLATPSPYRTCTDYSLPVSRRTAKECGHYL